MNINVVTDNTYFYIGLSEFFSSKGYSVQITHPNNLTLLKSCNIKEFDVFIFHTNTYSLVPYIWMSTIDYSGQLIFIPTIANAMFNFEFGEHTILDALVNAGVILDEIIKPKKQKRTTANKAPFPNLTEREKTTLLHNAAGVSIWSISKLLNISAKTVYAHRRNAFIKLGVRSFFEAYPIKEDRIDSLFNLYREPNEIKNPPSTDLFLRAV